MELSPEERQHIYLEEKARFEAQEKLKAEAKPKKSAGCGTWILAIIVGCLILIAISMIFNSANEVRSKQTAASRAVGHSGNEAHDRLLLLGAEERARFLGKITNENCAGIRSFYMGMGDDHSVFWSVACSSGKSFELQINADAQGSARVIDCAVLKAVSKINCFESLAGQ